MEKSLSDKLAHRFIFGDDLNGSFLDEKENPLQPYQIVPLAKIHRAKWQPRRYFDPVKLNQLSESIRAKGILEPLLVRHLNRGQSDEYELVAGERRYLAAEIARLTEAPVIVREMTNEEALQVALIENLQRQDLNPVEETEGILDLLSMRLSISRETVISLLHRMNNEAKGKVTPSAGGNEHAAVVEDAFRELGRMNWQSFVKHRLRVLNLPADILEAIRQGQIEYTKAQAIARLKEGGKRKWLLEEAIAQGLSLRQIEELVKREQPKPEQASLPPKNRFLEMSKRYKQSKAWDDPRKKKRLEKLLLDLEDLLSVK